MMSDNGIATASWMIGLIALWDLLDRRPTLAPLNRFLVWSGIAGSVTYSIALYMDVVPGDFTFKVEVLASIGTLAVLQLAERVKEEKRADADRERAAKRVDAGEPK